MRLCSKLGCQEDIGHKQKTAKYCSQECRIQQWRKDNPTKAREATEKWRKENKQKERDRRKVLRDANPEKGRAAATAWNKANPYRYKQNKSSWLKANPDKALGYIRKRRALKMNCPDSKNIPTRSLKRLLDIYNYSCAYGDSPFTEDNKVTWDHVVALSRGGRDAEGNLVPVCTSCNSSKGNKLLADWRRIKGPDYKCPTKT